MRLITRFAICTFIALIVIPLDEVSNSEYTCLLLVERSIEDIGLDIMLQHLSFAFVGELLIDI